MKGIILAGGKGSRLYPATEVISKQLLPVYDKPMIYYPLSTLMLGGIRDILIISTPEFMPSYQHLLGDGSKLGIRLKYMIQEEPRGLPEAFILGESFLAGDPCVLILGDNIFFGEALGQRIQKAATLKEGAFAFASFVSNPQDYGVCDFDARGQLVGIAEKPTQPKSHWAITGMYFYDHQVCDYAKSLSPSQRGELEITDLNMLYLKKKQFSIEKLGRGFAWFDAGTADSLLNASEFVRTIESRQRFKIGCLEEIAFRQGYIQKEAYLENVQFYENSDYGRYLKHILPEMESVS